MAPQAFERRESAPENAAWRSWGLGSFGKLDPGAASFRPLRQILRPWPQPAPRPGLRLLVRQLARLASRSRGVGILVAADFEPADLIAMDFVGSIRKSQEARRR